MNVTTFQKRLSSTIAAAALAVTGMISTAQDADAQNPNPIDWTISQTIFGPNGEDLPLRYGQHDFGNTDGFGIYHIQDGHGVLFPQLGK